MIQRDGSPTRDALEPWSQEIVDHEVADSLHLLVQETVAYAVSDSSAYFDIRDAVWGWGRP